MSSPDERGREKTADGGILAPANEGTSINVVFDLDDPEQAEKLKRHITCFGENYVETAPLVAGKVVATIYPGGAKELRR